MLNRSMIRECLTEKEITACLRRAFDALPIEDQENVKAIVSELAKIPRMGPMTALHLLFAVNQAGPLAKLNETLKGG